jgi:hypothetical protein
MFRELENERSKGNCKIVTHQLTPTVEALFPTKTSSGRYNNAAPQVL